MPVQNVRLETADQRGELRPDQGVGGVRLAADRDAVHPECEPRFQFGERSISTFAAGEAVGEDADLMTAFDLSLCKIEDVAKDAADRRAHRVQDSQRIGRNSSHLSLKPLCRRRETSRPPARQHASEKFTAD